MADRKLEARVRRLARRHGLELIKSGVVAPAEAGFGRYCLVDLKQRTIRFGGLREGAVVYDDCCATLEQIMNLFSGVPAFAPLGDSGDDRWPHTSPRRTTATVKAIIEQALRA